MSTALTHHPARIAAQLLVDVGATGAIGGSSDWATYATMEPDLPDNCVTVYKTEGPTYARMQFDGETVTPPGIQVRVRSATPAGGWLKAAAIRRAMCETVYEKVVRVESTRYLCRCFSDVGDVIHLGPDKPNSQRDLHTINAVLTVEQLP